MGAFKNESLSLPEEEKEGEVGAIAHSAPSPFFPPPGNPFSRGGGVGGGAGITSQMMINRLFMFAAGGRRRGDSSSSSSSWGGLPSPRPVGTLLTRRASLAKSEFARDLKF